MSEYDTEFIGTWDPRGVEYDGPDGLFGLDVPRQFNTLETDLSGLFEWGTRNNRVMLLAEAILLEVYGRAPHEWVELFTEDVLAKLPQDDFVLTADEVGEWVDRQRKERGLPWPGPTFGREA